jgi:transposase
MAPPVALPVQISALSGDRAGSASRSAHPGQIPAFSGERAGSNSRRVTRSRFLRFHVNANTIATRYEKTARNFLALVQLVCARLWLEN